MDNKEFGKKLEERTKKFAISFIRLSVQLPDTPEGKVIRYQLTKSGTSVGANYREANRARSKPDFTNKIRISEGECSETLYWLELIDQLRYLEARIIDPIIPEASELLAIFTSIRYNTKL